MDARSRLTTSGSRIPRTAVSSDREVASLIVTGIIQYTKRTTAEPQGEQDMASNPAAVTLADAIRRERKLRDTDHWRDRIQPNLLVEQLQHLEARALTAPKSELPAIVAEFAELSTKTKRKVDPELRPWWRGWR